MTKPLRTVLVGLGRIGASYVDDRKMAGSVPFVTHAQVLAAHAAFRWEAAVDVSADARDLVRSRFGVHRAVPALEDLDCLADVDVVVLATPPAFRLPVLDAFPNLKAVLVEKPLGATLAESKAFARECERRGIVTQVNLTRRADPVMRALANGGLRERIGNVQCGFGVYGNGVINYATHTVDLVRMLVGEISAVQVIASGRRFQEGPLTDDVNLSFTLFLEGGAPLTLHPVRFAQYREGSLDLWGEGGRLEILQEGLLTRNTPKDDCRSLEGAFELAADRSEFVPTGYGHALFDLYDDLAAVLKDERSTTCSSCESALVTESIVHAVLESARLGGAVVEMTTH